MNKHITAAALALTATLALVGCGNSARNSAAPTTTTTYRTTTTQYDNGLSAYLRTMRTRFPDRTDAQLVSLGEKSCDVINAYGSIVEAMIGIAEDPKWTVSMAGDAAFTMGAAIPVFCPKHLAELNRIAR